jgi:hypothetical protein
LYNTSYIFDPDKVQEVKKLKAKVKKDLYWYLNQKVKLNASDVILLPAIVIGTIFVGIAKCIPSTRPSSTRKG